MLTDDLTASGTVTAVSGEIVPSSASPSVASSKSDVGFARTRELVSEALY